MSVENLQAQSSFLELFLTTDKKQQKHIFKSLTAEQINLLIEILGNIFVLPHEEKDLLFYKKHKRFLSQFALNRTQQHRKKVLLRRSITTMKVLNYFKAKLLSLL